MAGKIFKTNPERLDYLIQSIHNREVALPDFQRNFVWDPAETEELIESICQNYPAGSLLKIRNATGFPFAPREFAGAPSLDGHSPSFLVLDGQQRLTSLYQALYGVGDNRYLFCLGGILEKRDLEDCVFYVRAWKFERDYASDAQQAVDFTLPISELFATSGRFEGWLDRILEIREETGDARRELKTRLRAAKEEWLTSLEQYEFPVVELAETTTADAVCTIFETLNRTGVKLSVFDLLGAKFWPKEVRLRDLWATALQEHTILAEYDIDPYYLLQTMALMRTKGAPSCKRGDVLRLTADDVKEGWSATVAGFTAFLKLLRDDCGVIVPGLVPYATMIITGSALMAVIARYKGPKVGAARSKIVRWFWCSALSQAYDNAANSRAARDYQDLCAWFEDGEAPSVVSDFGFDPGILGAVTSRQRAIYRSCMALILHNGALDFHCGNLITAKLMTEESIDDHHLFPAAYLAEHRPDVAAVTRDCILNRTYIDKFTNIRIGKRAPSDYLGEIAEEMGEERVDQILTSHMLPVGSDSPLRADDFDAFLDYRRQQLVDAIVDATGMSLATPAATEDRSGSF